MSADKITVAQIGCGYWGPNLLRNFSAQKDCTVKFVAESSAERRAYVESNFPRSTPVDNLEIIFDDPEVAAVIIATPASSHAALARRALAAGKHVFVEKPLATTTSDADDLIRVAEQNSKVLMAGHTF